MYDIIIVGAGPAGLTAALYARRAEKKVLVIEKEAFGGQITHSPRVENYPGFIAMSGNEFADKLLEQINEQGADIELDTVKEIRGEAGSFTVVCEWGEFKSKTVIIASGSKHRTLGLPKEENFTGEGISYCAVCDGAFYKDKTVAIIGGGNTALQEAILLSDGCKKVYVIQNLDFLTGETNMANKLYGRSNVEFLLSTVISEIMGEEKFEGVRTINTKTGEEKLITLDGMFVAIGQKPENEPFKNVVSLNDQGYIKANEDCLPKDGIPGIFVAGDCRTKAIRQITTATADGAVAALGAIKFLDN